MQVQRYAWAVPYIQHHNAVAAAHLGFEKTAARVRQVGYRVGMIQDIEKYTAENVWFVSVPSLHYHP